MYRVLYADDEPALRTLIRDYLEREGIQVTGVEDGAKALEELERQDFDLVILDVMMPGVDGWSVLKYIRSKSRIPVIMLTARDAETDELFGFELGADEYIAKPFRPRVLTARVLALLRRARPQSAEAGEGAIRVDSQARMVFLHGQETALSPREYELLEYFIRHSGQALSREMLLNAVWGYDYFGDLRTVDTHVKRLRARLGDQGERIETVRGFGYRFRGESQ